jgi:hypothetical protein
MTARWALIRAAIIKIDDGTALRAGLTVATGPVHFVVLRRLQKDEQDYGWLCVAGTPIKPPLTGESGVRIPSDARASLERCIEFVAHLFAVDKRTSHAISSPLPWMGFYCEDSATYDQFIGQPAEVPAVGPLMGGTGTPGIVESGKLDLLEDRLDGLALLAAALNNSGPLGRFLQLIRLFERAFRLAPRDLLTPLTSFLATGPHVPAESEVRSWLSARNPAAHADAREEFYLDADVNPLVPRMLEAAYDVLLNKESWRNPSSDRRDGIRPASGSAGGHDIFMTRGKEFKLSVSVLDGLSAYPLLIAGQFDSLLPEALWITGRADSELRKLGAWDPSSLIWPDTEV